MTPPPLPAHVSSGSRTKVIVITALVSVVVTSLAWVGIGAGLFFLMVRETPAFALTVEHPESAVVGETLTMRVKVRNDGAKDMKLADLDVYETLLDGFEVVSVKPKPRTTQSLLGMVTHTFSRELKPAETLEIEFELRAKQGGIWSGDIDACTPTQSFVTHHAVIEVTDP